MNVRRTGRGFFACAACALALALPAGADAAFPGTPGKIAWSSERGGDRDIWVADPDGSSLRSLTDDEGVPAEDLTPAWSADGKKIVFISDRAGLGPGTTARDIWVMNADGSGKTNLTPTADVQERNPAFSPDGERIVFTRLAGPDFDAEIASIKADGSGLTILSEPRGDLLTEQSPVFSPDGQTIYYSVIDRANQLWRMDSDGGRQQQLTSAAGESATPDVSPDGRSVLITGSEPGVDFDPYLVDADGANRRPVASLAGTQTGAVFSPGGDTIVVPSDLGTSAPDSDLGLLRLGESAATPIFPAPLDDSQPDWQPIPYTCRGRTATMVGSLGDDKLRGTPGSDVIVSLSGKDTVKGLGGADRICAGAGRDRLVGGKGRDILIGGPGSDRLLGGPGNDRLFGGSPGAGKSKRGKSKPDRCAGGAGRDKLSKSCG